MLMMAIRLLSSIRGASSEEQDTRTVEAVLAAAARRIGEQPAPAVWQHLEAVGVRWAWQMANLEGADWEKLGLSLGLKTAVKAELLAPSGCAPPESPNKYRACDELSDRMRRFLLLPDEDGNEAKPLREMSALFLGLLSMPPSDRQSLLLVLCELVALVSGLFISAPLELRSAGLPSAASPAGDMWTMPPTLTDGKDALVALIFLINFHIAVFAVTMAIYVAASGGGADDAFCEGAMSVLGACFAFFQLCVFFPLLALCFWQFFHSAESPYLMLVNVLIVLLFHHIVGGRAQRFLAEAIPLEVYHSPTWLLKLLRTASRGMGTTHLLAETPLRAAAERRAAKLRAQMMLDPGDGGRASVRHSLAAAVLEPRSRRSLRVSAVVGAD